MDNMYNYYHNQSENNLRTLQNARKDIIGELDAIIQYTQHLNETEDTHAKATLTDIMREEEVHVGQLFGLLFSLDPVSKAQFEKGLQEFNGR